MKRGYLFCFLLACMGCTMRTTTERPLDSAAAGSPATILEARAPDSSNHQQPSMPDSEAQIIHCTYQGYEVGDCPHLTFSCGDFGTAITDLLPEKEKKLWSDLTVENENGEMIANPLYVGQQFTIVHTYAEGWPCQPGYPDTSVMQRGPVSRIVKFSVN